MESNPSAFISGQILCSTVTTYLSSLPKVSFTYLESLEPVCELWVWVCLGGNPFPHLCHGWVAGGRGRGALAALTTVKTMLTRVMAAYGTAATLTETTYNIIYIHSAIQCQITSTFIEKKRQAFNNFSQFYFYFSLNAMG